MPWMESCPYGQPHCRCHACRILRDQDGFEAMMHEIAHPTGDGPVSATVEYVDQDVADAVAILPPKLTVMDRLKLLWRFIW